MPRIRKTKSKRKQDAIRHNVGIAAWRRAAAEYLRKGKFQHLPKKGTPEHATMRKRQQELIPLVQKEIDAMIKVEQKEARERKQANAVKRRREVARLHHLKAKAEARRAEEEDKSDEEEAKEDFDSDASSTSDSTSDTMSTDYSSSVDIDADTDMEVISDDTDGEAAEAVYEEDDWV